MVISLSFFFSLKLYDSSFDILEAQKTQTSPGILVGTMDILGYHNSLHHKSGILIPARRRIFLLSLAIFFRKYSCLVPIFNQQIEKLHSGGFTQIWSKVYQKLPLRNDDTHFEPKQLSMEQLGGIFIIAAYAYAFCLFVFCVELISIKIRCLRVLFQYL